MSDEVLEELGRISKGICENNDCELYENGERLDISRQMVDLILQLCGSLSLLDEKIPSKVLEDEELKQEVKRYVTNVMSAFASSVICYLFDEESPIHNEIYKKGKKA